MYNGYRLKIDGKVFNDSFIQKGTYSCVRQKRVIERWTDANLTEYELTAGTKKAVIKFQIREHNSAEHSAIMDALQGDDWLNIEYYSDREDAYYKGTFRCDDITFSHLNITKTNIDYARCAVTFTEH